MQVLCDVQILKLICYFRVKLLLNNSTGEAVAMKIIDLQKHPDARSNVKKEVAIHRLMSSPNVIQFFGQRREGNIEYLFLEYAAGGELFDRIEPDVGMAQWEAQKYFKELISGVVSVYLIIFWTL